MENTKYNSEMTDGKKAENKICRILFIISMIGFSIMMFSRFLPDDLVFYFLLPGLFLFVGLPAIYAVAMIIAICSTI